MKIIDTYSAIISLLDKMNGDFDIKLWENYINGISDKLLEKIKEDSKGYDFNKQVLPIIHQAINNRQKIEQLHNSFLKATDNIAQKLKDKLDIELSVDIILYLGLCNGAGWATKLSGKSVVLLGIEKIIELDWCDSSKMMALIYHELGHAWHDSAGTLNQKTSTSKEKSIQQLYQEGIAMCFEQIMIGDDSFYHQNSGNWLEWCQKNKQALNIEFLRRLQDGESTQAFFGDWCNYLGYSDVGYFIGCEFIKYLSWKYQLNELINLNLKSISEEFSNYVTSN